MINRRDCGVLVDCLLRNSQAENQKSDFRKIDHCESIERPVYTQSNALGSPVTYIISHEVIRSTLLYFLILSEFQSLFQMHAELCTVILFLI